MTNVRFHEIAIRCAEPSRIRTGFFWPQSYLGQLPKRLWQKLRGKANSISNEEYASEALSIIRLTKEEITAIIDKVAVDKAILSELVAVANDAEKSNSQRAEAIRNITGLAEVAVSVIGKPV